MSRETYHGRLMPNPKTDRRSGAIRGEPDHLLEFVIRDADGKPYAAQRWQIPAGWAAIQLERKEVEG